MPERGRDLQLISRYQPKNSVLQQIVATASLTADGVHRAIGLLKIRRIDAVTGQLGGDAGLHRCRNCRVVSRFPQQTAEIRFFEAEQAVPQFSVSSQTEAVTT